MNSNLPHAAREARERRRWGGSWLIGVRTVEQLGRRTETAQSALCARKGREFLGLLRLENKMEIVTRENKPRSRNWEWSHGIKEELNHLKLYSVKDFVGFPQLGTRWRCLSAGLDEANTDALLNSHRSFSSQSPTGLFIQRNFKRGSCGGAAEGVCRRT